jgi:hypothetical protein
MSSRLPPVPREELDSEQQKAYDHFRASASRNAPHPGAVDRATNTLFPVLAVLPRTGSLNVDLLATLEQETTGYFSEAVREVVSLVATTFFKSDYVTRIHSLMAVQLGLLSQAQADAITEGRDPADLSADCRLAYRCAKHLLETRGPLTQELWDECVESFQLEGTIGLVHYVALLSWTSLTLNVANLKVPEKVKASEPSIENDAKPGESRQ